jgi:hypothetical protein
VEAVTPEDVERQHTLLTATARFDELRLRDTLAPGGRAEPGSDARAGAANRRAAGQPGADDREGAVPLTRQEALELLALSEVIARKAGYGRQLAVRSARAAGASWSQIGAALGTTKQSAWEAHARWLDGQGSP